MVRISAEEKDRALKYFSQRLVEYSIVCSDEGRFYETTEWKEVGENALKCMLRLDYLRDNAGELCGSMLNNLIQSFIEQMRKFLVVAIGKPEFSNSVSEKTFE